MLYFYRDHCRLIVELQKVQHANNGNSEEIALYEKQLGGTIEMKRRIIIIFVVLLFSGIALAETDIIQLTDSILDWFAIQSADEAPVPEGLTDREIEIYRAGYANGHYDALHPAYIEGKFVLNTKTKKFHLTNCMTTLMIETENRKYTTDSPEELMANKYKPCGQCNPEREKGY